MAELDLAAAAQSAFDTLCQALDSKGIRYTPHPEKFLLVCNATGEDLPIDLTMRADPEKGTLALLSKLPLTTPEEKRMEMAIAICLINENLGDCNFDYDIRTGEVYFRMINCFVDCVPSQELFLSMLFNSWDVIDTYNDKLLMLAKNLMSMEQFLASLQN